MLARAMRGCQTRASRPADVWRGSCGCVALPEFSARATSALGLDSLAYAAWAVGPSNSQSTFCVSVGGRGLERQKGFVRGRIGIGRIVDLGLLAFVLGIMVAQWPAIVLLDVEAGFSSLSHCFLGAVSILVEGRPVRV